MKSIITGKNGLLGNANCFSVSDSEIWVGYSHPTQELVREPSGVSRFSLDGNLIAHYEEKDGLVNNWVTCLAIDEEFVWLGTKSGMSCFSNKTGKWLDIQAGKDIELPGGVIFGIASSPVSLWIIGSDWIRRFDKHKWCFDKEQANLSIKIKGLKSVSVDEEDNAYLVCDNKWAPLYRIVGSTLDVYQPRMDTMSLFRADDFTFSIAGANIFLDSRLSIHDLDKVKALITNLIVVGGSSVNNDCGVEIVDFDNTSIYKINKGFSSKGGFTVALDAHLNRNKLQGVIAWASSSEVFVMECVPRTDAKIIPRILMSGIYGNILEIAIDGEGRGVFISIGSGQGATYNSDLSYPQIGWVPIY